MMTPTTINRKTNPMNPATPNRHPLANSLKGSSTKPRSSRTSRRGKRRIFNNPASQACKPYKNHQDRKEEISRKIHVEIPGCPSPVGIGVSSKWWAMVWQQSHIGLTSSSKAYALIFNAPS